jgi:hypothetical protein
LETGGEHWRQALGNAGFSVTRAEADFDRGRFLYCGIGGGGVRSADFYGESIISPAYAKSLWSPGFEVVDYVSEDHRGPQALIIAKKSG